ncbi:hypothetical protein [Micavibrio aeruginosavorus]|uniref:hypothetical protein n=1 Tax=Micavibrio aeruginosavorus TaxID=349221 RepID=UPI003F4ACE7C
MSSISKFFSKLLIGAHKEAEPVIVPGFDPQGRLHLTFRCAVRPGEGAFNRMVFPGRTALDDEAAKDWPETLCPGSLNCGVIEFPSNFDALSGDGDRIEKLDHGIFVPEFEIPREMIVNNRVVPYSPRDNQRMGIAQAWHCAVRNDDSGECFQAWHVRRIDGTYPKFHNIIELMADRKLRDSHELNDNTNLTITMYSKQAL